MNEMESLEKQMRSWPLRPASKHLHNRIFGAEEKEELGLPLSFTELWRWVMPVCGSFALVILSLSPKTGEGTALARNSTNFLALTGSWSNQNLASYFSSDFHSGLNNLPIQNVEWTIGPKTQPVTTAEATTNTLFH